MTPEQPIRFAGSALGEYRHVCAFFHTQDEKYRMLLPFIKEGFDRGEKAFHCGPQAARRSSAQAKAGGDSRCGSRAEGPTGGQAMGKSIL